MCYSCFFFEIFYCFVQNAHIFLSSETRCSLQSQAPCAALTSLTFTYSLACCVAFCHAEVGGENRKDGGKWLYCVGAELLIRKPLNSFYCCVQQLATVWNWRITFSVPGWPKFPNVMLPRSKIPHWAAIVCVFPPLEFPVKKYWEFFANSSFECILWVICSSCEVFGL